MIFAALLLYHPVELLDGGKPGPVPWVWTALGVIAGGLLFAVAVVCWQRRRPFLWVVFVLTALWLAYSSYQLPSHVFLDFVALLIPWAVRGDVRRTVGLMVLMLAVAAIFVYLTSPVRGQPLWVSFMVSGVFLLSVVAAGQVWLVRMVLNLRRLSQVAERERVARELHDVLGQALTDITTMSGRVCALLGPDMPDPTGQAGVDVATIEALARQALADVRSTLSEYRAPEAPDAFGMNAT
jgi:signal transduction histidine kinase